MGSYIIFTNHNAILRWWNRGESREQDVRGWMINAFETSRKKSQAQRIWD